VKASEFAELVTVDAVESCFAVLEVFWYCLVCTSEYAEARVEACVEACVEVVSFLPRRGRVCVWV